MDDIFDDNEVFSLLEKERERQRYTISLIASENIVSKNILKIVGSEFTNKYAEGYPGKRYYGGCKFHDEMENLAIERAKLLFSAEHANVQPHSGSSANLAAFFSLANYGDTVLSMDLDHGGHLTHGSKVNFSGRFFNIIHYGVNPDTYLIDYDAVLNLAIKYKPKFIIAGASAYSRIIDFERFFNIAKVANAKLLVDMAHIAGLVAAGLHPSPVPFADIVTSTTHKTLRGSRGGLILCKNDYKKLVDSWVFPGFQGGPLMHEIAGKAVCFKEALEEDFKKYQSQILENSKNLSKSLSDLGYKILTGGTDNHMFLIDLRLNNLTGKEAEGLLEEIGIVANKNKIPFDPTPPTITSGLRLGTPLVTSRGMKAPQMEKLALIINACLKKTSAIAALKQEVAKLLKDFSY